LVRFLESGCGPPRSDCGRFGNARRLASAPQPLASSPDLRAAWHEALAALTPADGPGVRGMTDGRLLHLRDTYPLETAWAPQWTGDELRQARTAARDAHLAALPAAAEAAAARRRGDRGLAARQQELAGSYQAMQDASRDREAVLAANMADRADWEKATRYQRQLAVAADTELRRRYPGQPCPPLYKVNSGARLQHRGAEPARPQTFLLLPTRPGHRP
jgi:hypothetical protein